MTPNDPIALTRRQRRAFIAFAIGRIFVLLVLVVAVFAQGYYARRDIVRSQRIGCERGKLDRRASIALWSESIRVRKVSPDTYDRAPVAVFEREVSGLRKRAAIDCVTAYPEPGLLP